MLHFNVTGVSCKSSYECDFNKKKQQANKQTKNRTMCLTYLLSVTITFPLSFPCLGPGNQSSRQAPWEGERGREPGAGDEEAGGAAGADDRRGEGR